MAQYDPLPDHAYLKYLQADDSITYLMGNDFPTKRDNQSSLQPYLWNELHKEILMS